MTSPDQASQEPEDQPKPETFSVPVENMPWLERKLEQMNKRAAKLGCPPAVLTRLDSTWEAHRIDPNDPDSSIVYYEYAQIKVAGEAPVLSGWTLLAALQHVDGHTLVRTAPNQTLPTQYRGAEPWCDHCQAQRNRQETFVLSNVDGRVVQIGRNCLRDFLTGGHGPEALAFWATFQRTLRDTAEEAMEPGQRRQHSLDLSQYLSMVAACMRLRGWVSAKMAEADPDRLMRTSSTALNQLMDRKAKPEYRIDPEQQDADRAAAAVAWAKLLPENSAEDYLNNLGIIARLGYVPERMLGVAASMIVAYERAMGQERERRERKPSNYQGTVGKRDEWDLTVTGKREMANNYGFRESVTVLHLMQDAAGNNFKWFASNESLDEGKTYHVRGTVKAHEEYRGVQATLLTRCTVYEVPNGH